MHRISKVGRMAVNKIIAFFICSSLSWSYVQGQSQAARLFCSGPLSALPTQTFASYESRTLQTQNYPNSYLPLQDCTVTLQTSVGYYFNVAILSFYLETRYDTLSIFEGTSVRGRKIIEWSGRQNAGRSVSSNSNQITLRFQSDGSTEHQGFSIVVRSLPLGVTAVPPTMLTYTTPVLSGCSAHYTASSEWRPIQSPNWPQNYANSLRCTYSIVSPDSRSVHLYVDEFDTESCCDRLTISDGLVSRRWEGNLPYGFTYTGGRHLLLRFETDGSVMKRGFRIMFAVSPRVPAPQPTSRTLCNQGQIELSSGDTEQFLTSPGFPHGYPRTSCRWVIRPRDSESGVVLRVVFFKAQSNRVTVEAYNGDSVADSTQRIQSLNTDSTGSTLFGQCQSAVLVTFDSSYSTNGTTTDMGMRIGYSSGVSGNPACRKDTFGAALGASFAVVIVAVILTVVLAVKCFKPPASPPASTREPAVNTPLPVSQPSMVGPVPPQPAMTFPPSSQSMAPQIGSFISQPPISQEAAPPISQHPIAGLEATPPNTMPSMTDPGNL